MLSMTPSGYVSYLERVSEKIRENRDYITELDATTGDGDHWANLNTGFDRLLEQKQALSEMDFAQLFKTSGMSLLSGIGGSSGALYGSAYLAAAKVCEGVSVLTVPFLAELLDAELGAIMKRGNSQPGHKTMIDPLHEACQRLRTALANNMSEAEALAEMKAGAVAGMEATAAMEAVRGRACYQTNKGVGCLDPGAVTMCYQLELLADCMGNV